MDREAALLEAGWIRIVCSGHEAHRWFDLLSNLILAANGYGDFVAEFEKGVAGWHDDAAPYPRTACRRPKPRSVRRWSS